MVETYYFQITCPISQVSLFLFISPFNCSAGKPAIGGPWSLIDLDGKLVTNKSFEGKWTLLYFGFARCPDICPSEMVKVGKVMDTLKKEHPDIAENVVPIFVSVDPARDSLKALREYAKDFHPSYIFLTGSPEQVCIQSIFFSLCSVVLSWSMLILILTNLSFGV